MFGCLKLHLGQVILLNDVKFIFWFYFARNMSKLKDVVSADSAVGGSNSDMVLFGVAIEVENYLDFRNYYFECVNNLREKYKTRKLPKIIKRKIILNYVPSYNISRFIADLVKDILSFDSLGVYLTYTVCKSNYKFCNKVLSNCYTLVPVWQYIEKVNSINNFLIDNVDGKICKAWCKIGDTANKLYLVPYGDETYPTISSCDILCSYVRDLIESGKDMTTVEQTLKDIGENIRVYKFNVCSNDEFLKPIGRYTIHPQNHYPHPITFLLGNAIFTDTVNEGKKIIENTNLFRELLYESEQNFGCTTFIDLVNHIGIISDSDKVVCLDKTAYITAVHIKMLNKLNKLKIKKNYSSISIDGVSF